MNERKGEKFGWTLGFYGGFLWVLILSIIFFWQKKIIEGALGMEIVILAIIVISLFSPWRMPKTKYWKLYLFPYTLFIISIVWAIWALGGVRKLDLNWWNLLWLIPTLIPFYTIGKKSWNDRETKSDV